jgi:hypothetical protein
VALIFIEGLKVIFKGFLHALVAEIRNGFQAVDFELVPCPDGWLCH